MKFFDFGPKAQVFITVKDRKSSYCGGDVVEGEAYLNVRKDNFTAIGLNLQFEGSEKTVTHYTTHSGHGDKRRTHHHHIHRSRQVMCIPMPLAEWGSSTLTKQRTCFPFKFTLPVNNIPPTIPFIAADGGSAQLSYRLHLSLTVPGMLWGTSEIEVESPIMVSGGPKNPPLRASGAAYMGPEVFPITGCCCFSKGDMVLGARTTRTNLDVTDEVNLDFDIANNSTATIEHARFVIHAYARWSAHGHSNSLNWSVADHTAPVEEMTGSTEALTKSEKKRGERAGTTSSVFKNLDRGAGYSTLISYENTIPSYTGSLFTISHEITCTTKTPMCVTDPFLRTPVYISASNPRAIRYPSAPEVPVAVPVDELPSYEMAVAQDYSSNEIFYASAEKEGEAQGGYPEHFRSSMGSVQDMIDEMGNSVFDVEIVRKYLASPKVNFLGTLTTSDLKLILSNVDDVYRKMEIACLLLEALTRPIKVADITSVVPQLYTSSQKVEFINIFLPKCADNDDSGRNKIKLLLSEVEKMMVGDVLD